MLHNAMRVLRLFGPERRELSMAETARLTGRPASTVSRWLVSMMKAGFLERDPRSGRYRVGSALSALGALADEVSPVRRAGRAALARLANDTGETTYLGVLQGSDAVLVDGVNSPQPVRLGLDIGQRVALHATAVGKCLLAWQPREVIERLLPRRLPAATSQTITDLDRLWADLAKSRKRGFTLARGEWEVDLDAAAAPIRDSGGGVVAALSVGGPASRFRRRPPGELGGLVANHADQASAELGYPGPSLVAGRRP